MFFAFRHFYSSSTINCTPWFVLTNIAFGPWSYRKIPAVANQIAGEARIPPAHERKKNIVIIIHFFRN